MSEIVPVPTADPIQAFNDGTKGTQETTNRHKMWYISSYFE